jgi:hypothetical protein
MKIEPSLENQILIQYCNSILNSDSSQLSKITDGKTPDWNQFFNLVKHHRLYPIINNLHINQKFFLPSKIIDDFLIAGKQQIKRLINLENELLTLKKLFDRSNIEFIPVKGPAMILQIYNDYRLRQSRDLDILVKECDLNRVIQILEFEGFVLLDKYFKTLPEKRSLFLKRENHIRFRFPEKKIILELHWSVSKYFTRISTLNLFENSIPLFIKGKQFRTFTIEDYFVLLSIHGIAHRFVELFWLYDIAHIMKAPKVKFEQLLARSEIFQCQRAVKVSMALAYSIFDIKKTDNCLCFMNLTYSEKFLFNFCVDSIFCQKQTIRKNNFSYRINNFSYRIKILKYNLIMTNDWKSKGRLFINYLIKPYVWNNEKAVPKNNLIYLVLTQIKWFRLMLSGKMTKEGLIRKLK